MSPETARKRRARETWAVMLGPEDGPVAGLRRFVSGMIIRGRKLEVKRRLKNGTMICRETD